MKMNGRNACTGNSYHIDIIYFFINDQVYKGEIIIMYCPTHLMLADYFKKPIHIALFHKFRDIIMGRESPYKLLKIQGFILKKGACWKTDPIKINLKNTNMIEEKKLKEKEILEAEK